MFLYTGRGLQDEERRWVQFVGQPVSATNVNFDDPLVHFRKVLAVEMANGSVQIAMEHTTEHVVALEGGIRRAWYGDAAACKRWSPEHGKDVTDKFVELSRCNDPGGGEGGGGEAKQNCQLPPFPPLEYARYIVGEAGGGNPMVGVGDNWKAKERE